MVDDWCMWVLTNGLGQWDQDWLLKFQDILGWCRDGTMQEAKADAGTMERAELAPSGVACDISCLGELAHFIPLENLFL